MTEVSRSAGVAMTCRSTVDALEYGDGGDAPIQHHHFAASGTRYIGWILGVIDAVDFRHDHLDDVRPSVGQFCVLCRVEAWGPELARRGTLMLPC